MIPDATVLLWGLASFSICICLNYLGVTSLKICLREDCRMDQMKRNNPPKYESED